MFCCTLLYVHSSIAIILMGKRELIALLNLSSWCLVMVEQLFLAVPRGCLQFVMVVFPDRTHLLFLQPIALRECVLSNNYDVVEGVENAFGSFASRIWKKGVQTLVFLTSLLFHLQHGILKCLQFSIIRVVY